MPYTRTAMSQLLLVELNEISFDLSIGASPYRFTGKVTYGKMEGSAVAPGGGRSISWRASKLAAQKK